MARPLRIVCYGVNGGGVGHLTRLVAIGRWLRRYTAALGAPAELWFLTSSEATKLLFDEGFASFKVPSKTTIGDAGIDKTAYLALAKQWIWHSLGLLRPDLLIVDTFPRGSFGELLGALDLAQKRAFVYRPIKASFAERADFQTMLPLYDAIVVPETEEDAPVLVPEAARDRVHHVGPIVVREAGEMVPREEARARLGVPEGVDLVVYVSAGGGGDETAEAHVTTVCDALLAEPGVFVVVGAGPLYRGAPRRGPRVTWLENGGAAELAHGFDVAVSAAGYNTFVELMLGRVPTLFLPQAKIADDQAERAERAVRAGAAERLPAPLDPVLVVQRVRALAEPARAASLREAARSVVDRSHARDAAAVLLRLVLPRAEVDLAVRRVSDRALDAERGLGLDLGTVVLVEQALEGRGEGARDGARDGAVEPAGAPPASELALGVLELARELGFPLATLPKLLVPLAKKLPLARPHERAAAASAILRALAPFGDPPGAVTFVRMLATERALSATELVREVAAFLERLRSLGADLHEGALLLSRATAGRREAASNAELLADAGGVWS